MRRFFYNNTLGESREVTISGTDARHIQHVLRMKPGDRIILFNERGEEWVAVISNCGKDSVDAMVTGMLSQSLGASVGAQITVAQSMLKDRKMDVIVRQLTELGIARWLPVFAERSVPRPDSRRLAARRLRWEKITREALKQCGRPKPMEIMAAATFEEFITSDWDRFMKVMFWEEKGTGHPSDLPRDMAAAKDFPEILILIGPEGGFAPREVERATQAGFVTASLGPRILRAETASVAAATLVQYLFGDLH